MASAGAILINIAIQVVISLAIAALTPKQRIEGPRLDEKGITSSTYGEAIAIPYGTVKTAGNIIWGKDIREEAVTTEIGKGNPFSVGTNTSYFYYVTLAVGIAKRQVDSLIRIYADGKVIWDTGDGEGVENMEGLAFKFYDGSDTQTVDPLMAADVPDGEMPAYRGLCYIVFDDMPLENFGNRIPNLEFVISTVASSGKPVIRRFADQITNSGNTITFNESHLIAYDKIRDVMYVQRHGDPTTPYTPFYLEVIDAKFGTSLAKRNIEDITSGLFPIVLHWQSGDSPYIVMTCNASAQSPIYCIDKSDLTVLAQTGNKDNTGGGNFPYADDGSFHTDGSLSKLEGPKLDGSAGGLIFQVKRGFTERWYYMTGAKGEGALVGGEGYGTFAVLSLPDFSFAYTLNKGGDTDKGPSALPNENGGGIEWGDPTDTGTGYGVHGWALGQSGDGWQDVYFAVRSVPLSPWTLKLMHARIGLNGKPVAGAPTKVFDLPAQVSGPGSHVVKFFFDAGTDTMIVQSTNSTIVTLKLNTDYSTFGSAAPVIAWTDDRLSLTKLQDWTARQPVDGKILGKRWGGAVEDLSANFDMYDVATGSIIESFELGDWPASNQWVDADTGTDYDFQKGSFQYYDFANNRFLAVLPNSVFGWAYLGVPNLRNGETLDIVVSDIVGRSKLSAADIDVTELATKTVRGYSIGSEMTYRNALEPLATAYDFYAVENAGVLEFQFNKKTSDMTIPEGDLLYVSGENIFEEIRGQELEVPRALFVSYNTSDWTDEKNTQVVRRISDPTPAMGSIGEVNLELAMTLSDAEAAEITERIMYESWVRREGFLFKLSQRYLDILPSDNLTIAAEGRGDIMRVTRLNVGARFEIEIQGHLIDGVGYASLLAPAAPIGSPSYTRKDTVVGATTASAKGFLLDMPLLQDSDLPNRDGGALMYTAAGKPPSGVNLGFRGAGLQTSFNDDVFQTRQQIANAMSWGILVSTMPDIPDGNWNSIQEASVDIQIFNGASDFASVTQSDMVGNDANTAILYRPMTGEVEVIGFRDVSTFTVNNLSVERLTGFMRGKRGTDQMATGYPTSSTAPVYIIIADVDTIVAFVEGNSRNDASIDYRFMPPTHQIQSVPVQTLTYEHRSLMPYAPWHVVMTVDEPSVGNRELSWERRTRQSGSWGAPSAVALSEDSEAYEIDILSGIGGTVLRTLTSSVPSVSYQSEHADIDFGTDFPNPLYVRVYQMSAQVGRGFSYEAELQET